MTEPRNLAGRFLSRLSVRHAALLTVASAIESHADFECVSVLVGAVMREAFPSANSTVLHSQWRLLPPSIRSLSVGPLVLQRRCSSESVSTHTDCLKGCQQTHMLHSFAPSATTAVALEQRCAAGCGCRIDPARSQWATRTQPEGSSRMHPQFAPMATTRVEPVPNDHSSAHSKVAQLTAGLHAPLSTLTPAALWTAAAETLSESNSK